MTIISRQFYHPIPNQTSKPTKLSNNRHRTYTDPGQHFGMSVFASFLRLTSVLQFSICFLGPVPARTFHPFFLWRSPHTPPCFGSATFIHHLEFRRAHEKVRFLAFLRSYLSDGCTRQTFSICSPNIVRSSPSLPHPHTPTRPTIFWLMPWKQSRRSHFHRCSQRIYSKSST